MCLNQQHGLYQSDSISLQFSLTCFYVLGENLVNQIKQTQHTLKIILQINKISLIPNKKCVFSML